MPHPNGQPGFIRIDSVHQGDQDGVKGVYHINAVDEVTQFEVVCTVEKISERYLIPVLEQLLDAFPFVIKGFHSDNGSEYINKRVAKLLEKLLIESRKTTD
jgi:transposase InsO family protein